LRAWDAVSGRWLVLDHKWRFANGIFLFVDEVKIFFVHKLKTDFTTVDKDVGWIFYKLDFTTTIKSDNNTGDISDNQPSV